MYGEKRIQVDGPVGADGNPMKLEYRVWNPFRSKLAAAILGGIDGIHMKPGSKVLYLGAAAGTTVSHVSDIVGPTGCVYAVEFAHRPGRDLINMAKSRTNVIPIIEDARHPLKYRMLMGKNCLSLYIVRSSTTAFFGTIPEEQAAVTFIQQFQPTIRPLVPFHFYPINGLLLFMPPLKLLFFFVFSHLYQFQCSPFSSFLFRLIYRHG